MHGGVLAIHVDSTIPLEEFALLLCDHIAGVGRFQQLKDADNDFFAKLPFSPCCRTRDASHLTRIRGPKDTWGKMPPHPLLHVELGTYDAFCLKKNSTDSCLH